MTDMLIRNMDPKTLKNLKARAKRNGHSLQKEAKTILDKAAAEVDVQAILDEWKKKFAGRKFTSSLELLREDRER